MKVFALLAAAVLFTASSLQAAQAPKLETLLAEYKKARADVLGKLNEAYASQAEMMAGQYQIATNLEGADRARQFAVRLRDPKANNDNIGASAAEAAADPLATLQANYAKSREENLRNVYGFYATTAASLRQELLKKNDQAGAKVVSDFLEKIKGTVAAATSEPTAAATPARHGQKLSSK